MQRGAEILLEILHHEKVSYIFGNPGTTELPLMDALLSVDDIHYVLGLQEASVVGMADGYAQTSGKVGFVNLHTAGGLGHGMGAILNALIAQTPLVVTAGQQDTRHTVCDPLLYGDLVRISRPVVKWSEEIANIHQLPILLRRAFQDAIAPPSGPVFLSLPMDIMGQQSASEEITLSHVDLHSVGGGLKELALALQKVPVGKLAIIAGDEVYASHASEEIVELAEIFGAPIYGSSWPSKIPVPTSHPLWSGNLPPKADQLKKIFFHYDAVFALGGKSLVTLLYSDANALPKNCVAYQISSDPTALGRTYATRLCVVGDIKASLDVLNPILKEQVQQQHAYKKAGQIVAREKQNRQEKLHHFVREHYEDSKIHPSVAAYEVMKIVGADIPIFDEAVATVPYIRQFLDSDKAGQYFFTRGGALGWGMPAAVGGSLGLNRDKVVSLIGDGAAMYSPQALWTAAHEELPIVFVVMNNQEYNVLKNFMRQQDDYLSARRNIYPAMDLNHPVIDYQALAQSMGVHSVKVTKAREIGEAMEQALKQNGPSVVEIMISA